MVYKVVSTDEMDRLLDNCVLYLLKKPKSEQAAEHLLDGVSEVYSELECNPLIYRISDDPFMKELNYHEAKVPEMDYMIIYKVVDDTVSYSRKLCQQDESTMEQNHINLCQL